MKARFGWALASAMLLGSIGSAYAADMAVKAPPPVVPVDMWTGGYVGLNAGYGWGRDSIGSTAATGPCNTVGFGAGVTCRRSMRGQSGLSGELDI